MRRRHLMVLVAGVLLAGVSTPAWACGGLIGRNGAVNLIRTTTLAGYHDGVEHYLTAFQFAGGGGEFGSIVPLPGVPTSVERGGDWTLQRLVRETQPVRSVSDTSKVLALAAASPEAEVLIDTRIDALDITVLKGGAEAVGKWAKDHGFALPPDTPEVLDFYAKRSPIFMAARFDADAARARGQALGDGTPVHLTIPTSNPWVPLRILGLGKQGVERVQADVYLLTDKRPALLPKPLDRSSNPEEGGIFLNRSEPASELLVSDLRSDKGMDWIPAGGMWLTYLRIDANAGVLTHDLAIDASGKGHPSAQAAGLTAAAPAASSPGGGMAWYVLALLCVLGVAAGLGTARGVSRLAA
jgi:Uncharacterized protein conserved in bacteria (DUF2330)